MNVHLLACFRNCRNITVKSLKLTYIAQAFDWHFWQVHGIVTTGLLIACLGNFLCEACILGHSFMAVVLLFVEIPRAPCPHVCSATFFHGKQVEHSGTLPPLRADVPAWASASSNSSDVLVP